MGKETIAAIATGLTDSGIGIIRISGRDAVSVGNGLFRTPSGRRILEHAESHKLYYGFAADEADTEKGHASEDWRDAIIDEVMAVVMRAPKSFTGEDTVEFQCHGGVLVMQKILDCVLRNGARLAEPGEFTKRAFVNGRMDLSRAEAVIDVIHSQNEYALSASVNQLRGKLSEEVKRLRADILYEIAFIESALDDPEHVSLEGYRERFSIKVDHLMRYVEKLLSTADNGKLFKEGIRTVIVGKPNAGKSSFLNLLAGEERAIVTEIAGTTRDILQETVNLGGISLSVVDTAGIRHTEDTVEKIGVDRAKKYAKDADLIIYVVDSSVDLDDNDREIISMIQDKKVIVLLNKSDLSNRVKEEKIFSLFEEESADKVSVWGKEKLTIIRTSAREGIGMKELETAVKGLFFHGELKSSNETVITNMRHKEALQETLDSLKLVKRSLEDDLPEDFYSIDLMSAYASLGRIIGEEVDDDLVEEIFSKFCMGK